LKKKILFVRPTLGYGGADRVTLNLLKGFDRDLYLCDLALMRAEGEFISDLPNDVTVFDLKAKSLWQMWKPLMKLVNSSDYDILYSTCGGASMPMMLAAILARYRGITVVSERNILFPPKKSKTKRRLMLLFKKILYQKATWVTAVSKGVQQECIEILGTPKASTIVVNNPIINDDLLLGKEEKLENDFFKKFESIVLAIGRFEWQKDYDTLLNAFALVLKKQASVGLYILGKGPLEKHFRHKTKLLGISNNVCFGGFDKNPFKYLSACDVYVLSSRHEGMPGVLIQAMACGAACVSTDCPTGPNELIKDGENGYLVKVGDENGLSERILNVLEENHISDKFSTQAPLAIKQYYEKDGVNSYFSFIG
jgi:glycosyltransferase involved in cell wall biosynthesis